MPNAISGDQLRAVASSGGMLLDLDPIAKGTKCETVGMLPTLLGARLRLEPVVPEHLDLLVELNSDAEVMRYVAGRPRTRAQTVSEWSGRCGPRSDHDRGLGYWAGYLGADFVGWWGLGASDPSGGGHRRGEFGFRLRRAHWGRGLATEGGVLSLEHGFDTADLEQVWAGTTTDNHASQAALSAMGLRRIAAAVPDRVTYAMTASEWSLHRAGSD